MAKTSRGSEFWARVVAEARTSGAVGRDVAAKHGVTVAALKYHLYESRGSNGVHLDLHSLK